MAKAFYKKIVFPRLSCLMEQQGINGLQLSRLSGVPYPTLRRKLTGESELLLNEAIEIRNAIAQDRDVDELFSGMQ